MSHDTTSCKQLQKTSGLQHPAIVNSCVVALQFIIGMFYI